MKHVLAVLALMMLAACEISSFEPKLGADNPGKSLVVTNSSYAQVWQTTYNTIQNAYHHTSDEGKQRGEIRARSLGGAYGVGNHAAVYITPTSRNAPAYTVKVVVDREKPFNAAEATMDAAVLRDALARDLREASARVTITDTKN